MLNDPVPECRSVCLSRRLIAAFNMLLIEMLVEGLLKLETFRALLTLEGRSVIWLSLRGAARRLCRLGRGRLVVLSGSNDFLGMLRCLPVVSQLLVRLVYRQANLAFEYLVRVSGARLSLLWSILIGTILVSPLLRLLNSLAATFFFLHLILVLMCGTWHTLLLVLVSSLLGLIRW